MAPGTSLWLGLPWRLARSALGLGWAGLYACAPALQSPSAATVAAPERSAPARRALPTGSSGPARPRSGETEPGPAGARRPEDIAAVILGQRSRARECYDSAARANPQLGSGEVVVGFQIASDGHVKSARVSRSPSDLSSSTLESCLLAFVSSLAFEPSARGLESQVRYPFRFTAR